LTLDHALQRHSSRGPGRRCKDRRSCA
jgi:hypothetical protein